MKVGVFRRIGSYLLDILPIFAILSLLFTFFIGDLLEPEGYDTLILEYTEITTSYNEQVLPYFKEFQNGELTKEGYDDAISGLTNQYMIDSDVHVKAMIQYFKNALIYYAVAFTVVYYAYSVITKGHTLGRKIMKIELQGKITWWTLLVREVIWKTGYYMLTLLIGGILIDFLMISFSSNKKAPRDFVTGITVKFEGADYPF